MAGLVTLALCPGDKIAQFTGNSYSYKDLIKVIPGSNWNKKTKSWQMPIENLADAQRIMPSIVITPDLLKVYSRVKGRLDKALAVKTIDDSTVSCKAVKGIKGKPYPYQAVGKLFLDTLEDQEGAILAFDMGLGKTLTGLMYFQDQLNQGNLDYCLVVCPSPLKYSTWAKEIEKWTSLEYQVIDGDKSECVEYEDGVSERLKGQALREVQYQQYLFGSRIIIVNYELFLRDTEIMPPVDSRWLVILDECFPYDTKVQLADGTSAYIGNIVENKLKVYVASYNTNLGVIENKPIVNWHKNLSHSRLIRLTLVDGQQITMTENHKVFTKNRGYVVAKELTEFDEVIICQPL